MDLDLDGLDDEKKGSTRAPSRVHRHAPKSTKPVPKPAPRQSSSSPKPESLEPVPKPEFLITDNSLKQDEQDSKPSVIITPKAENGAVDMEIAPEKAEAEEESKGGESMDEDGEEEDMIVREIDVYFTPSIDLNTQLYVLQYPLRPCWRPYELEDRCEEVRVKPASAEVEVDLALDLETNCDADFANKLNMTKQTLSSFWKPPRATGYAVGVLMGNELHLNPVHAVVQLRPTLEHLKSGGLKRKNNTGNVEVSTKLKDTNEVKSSGPSNKQQNMRMESTEQKTDDEESWVALKYQGLGTDFSARYLQRMVAKENSPIDFTMKPYEYVNFLCPGACKKDSTPKGPSRRQLLTEPLEERMKLLLSKEPFFHRFSTLMHFAPDDPTEDVLEVLQQIALLIQGLWTLKPSLSPRKIDFDPLIIDYILLQFSKKPEFSLVNSDIPINRRGDAKRFLETIAVERQICKDWKFKEQTDEVFTKAKQYKDAVEKQKHVWGNIEENVMKIFKNLKSNRSMKNVVSKPGTAGKTGMESSTGTRQSGGGLIGRKMSDETREALPKALKKVFQHYKVCSLQLICQGLRELAVSQASLPKADGRMYVAAANGIDAPQQEFKEVISEVATNIHGLYVLKSSPDYPEYDPLRKVVIDLLRGKEFKAKLKKTEVFSAAKIDLKRDITNNEYNKVMNDLCESKGSVWVLKSGDGSSK
ncbi:Sin_N domain-containing protein [Cephalotus follicularis]|uniref:Sin_N domain-containing protein n=1 Tax=Cephalotus follicularis TaxID=3775 RepID=A0A1Q3BNC0_CEPFO|nr:Sin_N domain-containing protein [Cephalotus follicularis]